MAALARLYQGDPAMTLIATVDAVEIEFAGGYQEDSYDPTGWLETGPPVEGALIFRVSGLAEDDAGLNLLRVELMQERKSWQIVYQPGGNKWVGEFTIRRLVEVADEAGNRRFTAWLRSSGVPVYSP